MATTATTKPQVRLRPIALPTEHGGWGMLGAPILAGLMIAPSWPGLCLGLAGASAFLARQPFRLALTDVSKRKRYPRTGWAMRFAGLYILAGLIALSSAFLLAKAAFWIPLLIAAILGGTQFSFDFQSKGRSFLPEACGAAAMALLSSAIVEAAGYPFVRSWLPAIVLALQAGTAISYAAARVRLARNVQVPRWPIWVGHVAALTVIAFLATEGRLSWPVVAAFLVLAMRASWGLSAYRRNVKAAIVGLQEVGYTLMTVLALWLSMR